VSKAALRRHKPGCASTPGSAAPAQLLRSPRWGEQQSHWAKLHLQGGGGPHVIASGDQLRPRAGPATHPTCLATAAAGGGWSAGKKPPAPIHPRQVARKAACFSRAVVLQGALAPGRGCGQLQPFSSRSALRRNLEGFAGWRGWPVGQEQAIARPRSPLRLVGGAAAHRTLA